MTTIPLAALALAGVLAAALAGCAGPAPASSPMGPGMMGRPGAATAEGAPEAGMMGGADDGAVATVPPQQPCAVPTSLPGHVVTVGLAEMGMMAFSPEEPAPLGEPMTVRAVPSTVPAGQVSLVARNMGRRPHEVVVLPLAAGAAAGRRAPRADGTIDESGTDGEVSAACGASSGEGIPAGGIGWTTLTLAPGRYEIVCNLANHYADGMHQELDVSP
ncbi:hypothetical protein ACR9E3_02420 [Actinomycetospora sp. C-140]